MATFESGANVGSSSRTAPGSTTKRSACEELGRALDSGHVGDIVAKHEKLILQYYEDVQNQATESFKAAKFVSYIGRVEDWRGIPKVQPSRFSPFPLGVP